MTVRLEKEYEARIAAKKNAEKVNLIKEPKVEEQKTDENAEPIKKSRDVDKYIETTQGYELAQVVESSGDDLGGQTGASSIEDEKTEMISSCTENFAESLSGRLEYEESWEEYINGE